MEQTQCTINKHIKRYYLLIQKITSRWTLDRRPTTEDTRNIFIYRSDESDATKLIYGSDIPYELIFFPDRIHESNVYIKFPDDPYFLEMPNVGMSSCGTTREGTCQNPYSDYDIPIQIFTSGENAFVNGGGLKYGFLKSVHNLDDYKNEYYRVMPKYHSCEYIFDVKELNLADKSFLIITRPKFNYTYKKLQCFLVNLDGRFIELDIDTVGRARDGGTTTIRTNPCEYYKIGALKIHSQTPFKKDRKSFINEIEVDLLDSEDMELNLKLIECVNLQSKVYNNGNG